MPLNLDHHIRLDSEAIRAPNLTSRFSKEDLTAIANYCLDGYAADKASRRTWFDRTEAAMDLAMQVVQEKSFPWPGAANIAFPLVTIAALQFHARAYPTIISGPEVVKCRVAGVATLEEKAKADRVGRLMSYQVLEQDQAWEEQHDRLLLNYSIVGCGFVKTYRAADAGHNKSHFVSAKNFVLGYYAKSVETCRRKTEILPLYRNDIWEKCAAGIYRDVRDEAWFRLPAQVPAETDGKDQQDKRTGMNEPMSDMATPFFGLEQHTWLDLDGDGYEEPYIVVLEETSRCVLRIVSRVSRLEDISRDQRGRIIKITAEEYYTKYGFIPSPDGGIYDIGFGVLLGPLNESVSTIINQLVDAGTMVNTGGGFLGRGAKIRGGQMTFAPFEWKRVDASGDDIRKNVLPLPVNAPSDVLFKLLGLLIDYTNRISGATEMLVGENPGQNTKAGVADHLVEQGLKIYSAIFKRCWRSMKEEFKKLYVLNAMHLPPRQTLWNGLVAQREDFLDDPNRIVPTADPNITSEKERLQRAMMIAQRAYTVPGYNLEVAERSVLLALRADGIDTLYPGPQKVAPLPNQKVMVEEAKTKREMLKIKYQAQVTVLELQEQHALNEAHISQLEAAATKLLAEAKGVDVTLQINSINAAVGAMKEHNAALHKRAELILEAANHVADNQDRGLQPMAGPSSNQGSPGPVQAGPGGGEGGLG